MYQRKEMKYILLCFAAFSIGANADLVTLQIEEAQDSCKNVTGIDQTLIDQAQNGQFSDDGKLRQYYRCYGSKMGYINVEFYGSRSSTVEKIDRQDLKDWLVDKLQYDSKTIEDAFASCGLNHWNPDVFQSIKCLSEKKLPVDVVSANYVDRSVEDLNKLDDNCKDMSKVEQNLITEAQNGNVPDSDSESLGSYYTCYILYGGIVDVFGNISYSYLKHWFELMLKQKSDKVVSAIDKCYKSYVEKETDILEIIECFAKEKLPLDVMAN